MKQICSRCHIAKPLEEFNRNRWNPRGFTYQCRECRKAYRATTAVKDRATAKAYVARNRTIVREKERLRRTGFTAEYWNEMLSAQEGCCGSCGVELNTEVRKGDDQSNMACGDHDHKTGKPRGILCWECNIGRFDDDPDRLRLHAEYLEIYA